MLLRRCKKATGERRNKSAETELRNIDIARMHKMIKYNRIKNNIFLKMMYII